MGNTQSDRARVQAKNPAAPGFSHHGQGLPYAGTVSGFIAGTAGSAGAVEGAGAAGCRASSTSFAFLRSASSARALKKWLSNS